MNTNVKVCGIDEYLIILNYELCDISVYYVICNKYGDSNKCVELDTVKTTYNIKNYNSTVIVLNYICSLSLHNMNFLKNH